MELETRPATPADAKYIAAHLREDDRREIAALGADPAAATMISFHDSDLCLVGLMDNVPILLFGIRKPLLRESADIWALGTDGCGKAPRAMVQIGRRFVREALKVCPVLENYCDARYEKALRWLRMLGFTLDDPEPYGPKGALFRKLHISRPED